MMHDAVQHALDADATTSLGDAACPRGKWGCSPEFGRARQGQSMASVAAPHHPRITQEKRRRKKFRTLTPNHALQELKISHLWLHHIPKEEG